MEAKQPQHKTMSGVVLNTSNAKTINVLIKTYSNHPIYKKRIKRSKKYLVHDEKEQAKTGDFVEIIACRPLSRHKHFRLLRIIEAKVKKNDQNRN